MKSNLALSTAYQLEFQEFVKELNPNASLPCRQTLSYSIIPEVVYSLK